MSNVNSPGLKNTFAKVPSVVAVQEFSGANVVVVPASFTYRDCPVAEVAVNGLVSANYTNGLNIALGRLVMVNFNNQNGLKQIGNATYVETSVSGVAAVGEAGADGYGTILSGSLERSNVDITEELVNLITAQRNFQANAKTIETNTSLTQAIIQIRT